MAMGKTPFPEVVQFNIERLLAAHSQCPSDIVKTATALFDAGAVFADGSTKADLPDDVVVFHAGADSARIAQVDEGECALFNGELALGNGVIVTSQHDGLLCSSCPCSFSVCPFALAACFSVLTQFGVKSIPLLSRSVDANEKVSAFVSKWTDRLQGSSHGLNLLLSKYEDDFSGMVVLDGDSYIDEFVDEIADVLTALGKIDDSKVVRIRAEKLLMEASARNASFASTSDKDLAPRTLYVIDRLGDILAVDPDANSNMRFFLERLGHIVDDRYYLLVGTERELSGFVDMNPAFSFTFGQHRLYLVDMDAAELYSRYLENLDANVAAQVTDSFRGEFIRFVDFNKDALPFRGAELADYLAKHSNALKTLALPHSRYQSASLEEMLSSVVGLDHVKNTVRKLEQFALYRKQAAGRNVELPPANMHMAFVGSPGTGKTTIARIITTMLYKIGIIRRNKCVEVSSKDLIAKYVGHTDKQTAEKVREAIGGVLFIDEAYALVPNAKHGDDAGFGKEALAELVRSMEEHRDDLIVIFAGYEKEMREFIDLNPGMKSRIGYTFHFEDYTTAQLTDIFRGKAERAGLGIAPGAESELAGLFDYFRRFKGFGNGRFVEGALQKALEKHAGRCAQGVVDANAIDALEVEDVPSRYELFGNMPPEVSESTEASLARLVGLDSLKEKIADLERTMRFREDAFRAGLALPDASLHMVLTGNPGTGKTTVARILGGMLYRVGAVANNRFVEVEARDLVSTASFDVGKSVEDALESAMGGVLFLDEAYALMESPRGLEVIAILVKAMEDRKGELAIMFAGYRHEMRRFLDSNPGLVSRVGYTFDFEDYSYDELVEIFTRKAGAAGLRVTDEAVEQVRQVFKYFHRVKSFGNGRFVDRVMQEAIARHARRYDENTLSVLAAEDIPPIDQLCKESATTVYEPSDLSGDDAFLRVASHEVGHALCRLELTGKTDIVSITMEQEGDGALGYVQHEARPSPLPTSVDLRNELVSLMGGMAAEQVCFGAYSAGNSSDLQAATRLAANFVATYGMSAAGMVQYLPASLSLASTEATRLLVNLPDEVREEMNLVLKRAFEDACQLIEDNRAVFDALVAELMRVRTLTGEELTSAWGAARTGEDSGGECDE